MLGSANSGVGVGGVGDSDLKHRYEKEDLGRQAFWVQHRLSGV